MLSIVGIRTALALHMGAELRYLKQEDETIIIPGETLRWSVRLMTITVLYAIVYCLFFTEVPWAWRILLFFCLVLLEMSLVFIWVRPLVDQMHGEDTVRQGDKHILALALLGSLGMLVALFV
jgi:cation transporter-like permease